MTTYKTRWLLVGLVCLALWPVSVIAQDALWKEHIGAAYDAVIHAAM